MKTKPTLGTGVQSPRTPDNPEQSERFKEKARELEADENGRSFAQAMDRAVPVKPPMIKPRAQAESKKKKPSSET